MATAVPELDLLAPRDAELDSETDQWPELSLSNAYAHLPGHPNTLVNLLEAAAGYPLTVVGQLETVTDEDSHIYVDGPPAAKKLTIKLEDVRTFSYGQLDGGGTAVWAAGKAGWYQIKPAKKYRSIYAKMCQAVETLYFVADACQEMRKNSRGRGKKAEILPPYSADELFEKYAKEELDSKSGEDGQKAIYEHKEFLLSSMLNGKEGLSWSQLPIYKHLSRKFPDVLALARARQHSKPRNKTRASRDRSESSSKRRLSVGSSSAASSSKRQRGMKGWVWEVVPPNEGDSRASLSQVATPQKDEDSDEELQARNQKNKSSLRPRASKASKSATRNGGMAPGEKVDDDSADGDAAPQHMNGTKRKHHSEATEDHNSRRISRRKSKPLDDEGIDIPSTPEGASSPSSTEDGAERGTVLPIRDFVPDPVQEDTWVCALNGCTHKIYQASQSESQRLIKEHYALHAYDDDERVQMVRRLQAPSLPAARLMDKVKLQAKQDGFPATLGASMIMPDQVRSRYGIAGQAGVVQRY